MRYAKQWFWQHSRLLFPSPAEIRFIELLGGKVLTFDRFRHHKTDFPFAIVVSLGRLLRSENMKREVRVGGMYIDFGNDLNWGIEVDGRAYHKDIVVQQERDEYFENWGWRVLHIDATDLYRQPDKVQQQVMEFLTK